MELQNQIYLLVATFGGISALLLVFIAILTTYVVGIRKMLVARESNTKCENYGFDHNTAVHHISEDMRSKKSEPTRQPYRNNITKPRNEDINSRNNDRRKEKRPEDNRKRQCSESGDTSGRDFDSAFDNEINNMFDIDDEGDQDSVISDRNARYNQKRNHPIEPSGGRSSNHNSNATAYGNNRPQTARPPGDGYRNTAYVGNPHERKTYFNGRGMNY
ncbi:uncharacterized protein LOC129770796 [Toxorhynchites rutilus septentrionalis]|uniref:uncharacterized protein LOC129770796 n=1 Tax=Toxorhynchites rutilus septentrionalis TaxID=329112 RepID=UPI002478BF3C|nr:uncharacterized protein LOC129770796 [Toxorhynchites rutilus septentrionalis]